MSQLYDVQAGIAYDEFGDPYNVNSQQFLTPSFTESDLAEMGKMQRYNAAPQGQEQAPWWQNLVGYGIVKAIDNTFPNDPRGVQGNTQAGSFAGANGRTYNQTGPINAAPYSSVGALVKQVSSMSPVMLVALAAGVYFLLRK